MGVRRATAPNLLREQGFLHDGIHLATISDVAKYKNSVGQLVAIAESERQTPITEFIGMILAKFLSKVKPKFSPRSSITSQQDAAYFHERVIVTSA